MCRASEALNSDDMPVMINLRIRDKNERTALHLAAAANNAQGTSAVLAPATVARMFWLAHSKQGFPHSCTSSSERFKEHKCVSTCLFGKYTRVLRCSLRRECEVSGTAPRKYGRSSHIAMVYLERACDLQRCGLQLSSCHISLATVYRLACEMIPGVPRQNEHRGHGSQKAYIA
jgi:hypothetical protein